MYGDDAMKSKRPGFSAGTILILCLTAAVAVGCVFMFGKMRSPGSDVHMDAERVLSVVNYMIDDAAPNPLPSSTVSTVKVTLDPVTLPPATPAPTPTPEIISTPQARSDYSLSLTAGGLMGFESDISDAVYDKAAKSLDYASVVSGLKGQLYADLNLVTLPMVINAADRKYGDTLAPGEAADALQSIGTDVAVLGTEHILNQGAQGAADTVRALTEKGLATVGVTAEGMTQHRLMQLNGEKIAVLSYTEALTAKGKNALTESPALMKPYDADTARQEIMAAKNQGARCVIVCMYWARQDTASVTNAQRNTARALAEMGADVILGARPSRVLPVEILEVTGPDGRRREALAAYSLGTLLTESREGFDISGMLLHVSLRSDSQGMTHFDSVEYTPTYIWRQTVDGKMQYRVVCSADPAPEGMSEQQREVMARALNRIQTAMQGCPVRQRQ